MDNKILITILDSDFSGPATRTVCAKVSLKVYDRIEEISRTTNRTRSDIARIILTQAVRLVEIKKNQ